tara:strand:- start:287 stop:3133 length:2847 start_codon:yes stop_codon:yes gene_type:complete
MAASTSNSKRGICRVQKLYSETMITGTLNLAPGTYNKPLSGGNGGLLPIYQDFQFASKPTFGTSIFNSRIDKETGGSWDIWNLQAEQQSVANSRGQTWQNSEWIRTMFNYETYVMSGAISGRVLSLSRGEGLGNVHITNMTLDQAVVSSNEFFSFVKTGGGQASSNVATPETFTMEFGNIFLNSTQGQSLKKKTSFVFDNDTFLEIAETPDSFQNSNNKTLASTNNSFDFGAIVHNNDAYKTLTLCTSLGTDTKINTILLGHGAGDQTLTSTTNNNNISIGNSAMLHVDGSNNTCLGVNALSGHIQKTNSYNTGVGFNALFNCANNSDRNIAIGTNAGKDASSSNCVWIGTDSGIASDKYGDLALGSLITGIMTNNDDSSQLSIHASTIFLGKGASSITQQNEQLDKTPNQVWLDIDCGNILRLGNGKTGSSYDIVGGNVDNSGKIHLITRGLTTPNIQIISNVYTGSISSGTVNDLQNKISLVRTDKENLEISNVLHSNNNPTSCVVGASGNVSVITAGNSVANVLLANNAYTGDITSGYAHNNTLLLHRKNKSDITVNNIVSINNTIIGGYVDESNTQMVLSKHDGSSIAFHANFPKGHVTNGTMNTDSNLHLQKQDLGDLVVPNLLHADYTLTSNSHISDNGNITLVTKGASLGNIHCIGDVYQGTVENCSVVGNQLVLHVKGSTDVEIENIVPGNAHISSSTVDSDGNVLLTTEMGDSVTLYKLTNRAKKVHYDANVFTIERYDASNIEVTGFTTSSTTTTQHNLIKIPDSYKNDKNGSGYRAGKINITYSSLFNSSTIPTILHDSVTSFTNYGTYAGHVVFEFSQNAVETSDAYAINEIELVLTSAESFTSYSAFYDGLVSFQGSADLAIWYDLNIPHGYLYNVWKRKFIGNRMSVSFRLTKNINNYKYYKIEFGNFGSTNLPQIACVNFNYDVAHETDYTYT